MKYLFSIFYIGAGASVAMGLYKLFAYYNPDSYILEGVNAYVGGDAYNYIINSSQATAYFVLAGVFAIIGSSIMIVDKIGNNKY